MGRRSLLLVALLLALAGGIAWIVTVTGGRATSDAGGSSRDVAPAGEGAQHAAPALAEAAPVAEPVVAEPEAGDAATETRTEAQTGGAGLPADAIWVEGRVSFPPIVPPDERAVVVALGRKMAGKSEHEFEIRPDGRFRAAFAADTKKGWLRLEGRYLYTSAALAIQPADPPQSIVLEAKLGGCVRLALAPSAMARPRASELPNARAEAYGWSSGGEGGQRRGKSDAESRIELGGLDPELRWSATVSLTGFASGDAQDLAVEPGRIVDVPVEMRLASRLAGIVRDESGAPLDGVAIEYELQSGNSSHHRQSGSTKDGGRFAVDGLGAGRVTVRVSPKGAQATSSGPHETSEGSTKDDLEIVVRRGQAISGIVRWPDGAPAAKAQLELRPPQPATFDWSQFVRPVALRSGDDGRFEFRGLTEASYTLSASARRPKKEAGAGARDGTVRREDVAAGTTGIELVLEAGLTLRGRVVDDRGQPLAKFDVHAETENGFGMGGSRNASSKDPEGRFELSGLTEGVWQVRAIASGAESANVAVKLPDDLQRELVLTLARPARISGRVLDPDGALRAGALVVARARRGSGHSYMENQAEGRSGADGTFVLERAPSGALRIAAGARGAAESEALQVDVAPGQSLDGVELRLRRGGTITGTVRDARGNPEAGTEVSAWVQDGVDSDARARTAADGTFRIEHVAPGVVQVHAQDDSAGWDPTRAREVRLADGETAVVELGGAGTGTLRVTGTVRAGAPVAGAQLLWNSRSDPQGGARSVETDAEGRYEVTLASSGRHWVSVVRPGGNGASREVDVPAGASATIDFELPSGRIAGRVVDARGKPVSGIRLSVQPEDRGRATESGWRTHGSVASSADGRFEFGQVGAGTYRITTSEVRGFGAPASRHAPASVGGITLREGEVRTGIEVRLPEAGSILATVLLPGGAPASGATVAWNAGERWQHESTDAAGRVRIDGLAEGRVALLARTATATVREQLAVDVRAGETGEVTLQLGPGTVLLVRLEEPDGTPIEGAFQHFVRVVDAQERPWDFQDWSASHAAGAHRFGPLPDGDYVVQVHFSEEPLEQAVRVAGGGEVTATVRRPE